MKTVVGLISFLGCKVYDGKFVHLGGRFVLFDKHLLQFKWYNWISYKCNFDTVDQRDKHEVIQN